MSKHETSYARKYRAFFRNSDLAIEALAEYVELRGKRILEYACGDDSMARALEAARASVTTFDFGGGDGCYQIQVVFREKFDGFIINPPYGPRGEAAEGFVAAFIDNCIWHGFLAFLLPADFDSAVTRRRFFDMYPNFIGKIVIPRRVKRFQNPANPKGNAAWFLWERSVLPGVRRRPIVIYARPPLISNTAKSDQRISLEGNRLAARPHNCAPKRADTERGFDDKPGAT